MRWMSHRRWALAGGLLLALAAAPGLAAPQGPAQAPSPTLKATPVTPPAPYTQETAPRISAAEARQALAKGQAVLVDVRPKESYDTSHAQGALSIPLSDIGSRAGELPKNKLIITYCT